MKLVLDLYQVKGSGRYTARVLDEDGNEQGIDGGYSPVQAIIDAVKNAYPTPDDDHILGQFIGGDL